MLTGPQNSPAEAPRIGSVSEKLKAVRGRVIAAAAIAGRPVDGVTLVAVSKQQSSAAIRLAAAAGQRDFGENYLQEALPKIAQLTDLDLTWHYIGQLQSNKTRSVAECFSWAHTVDRLKVAERLNEQRPADAAPLNVCVQIKLADEPGKGGVPESEVLGLAERIAVLPRLRLRGLMCIPPPHARYSDQFQDFDRCRKLLLQLQLRHPALDTLSMGMSADLEAAVAAGATIVRVGTAIFGERE
jgi:PLP dependent protein